MDGLVGRLVILPDEWAGPSSYLAQAGVVTALPGASCDFSGFFCTDEMELMTHDDDGGLVAIVIDTGNDPNPALGYIPGRTRLTIGVQGWTRQLDVGYVQHLTGNRWIFWCEMPGGAG
jgi:hypothetical protein